jgi:hypothetical protein
MMLIMVKALRGRMMLPSYRCPSSCRWRKPLAILRVQSAWTVKVSDQVERKVSSSGDRDEMR